MLLPLKIASTRLNDGSFILVNDHGQIARVTFKGEAKRGQAYCAPDHEGEANAAYIVHACNLYPKLVEILRNFTEADPPSERAMREMRKAGYAILAQCKEMP